MIELIVTYAKQMTTRRVVSRYNECCLDADVFSSKDNAKSLLEIIDNLQAVK
ncbi:hypothetical protein [Limosilactobacillus vaginalis]|uniref:hypothetical protein n=1 Tax=Limosilactobacillus vaginalis TaxID=1633 RepID=UPI0021E06518|nr:hypothetical protein [Limosilactobacillus vaginalis]UYD07374.1 hypothetical protein NX824_00915 [Limosilactobacillus vaginalis]